MNVEEVDVSIKNPEITFYGPHPCDLCGGGPIIRGSVSQGFGDIRLESPNEPIYPNRQWQEHKCGDGQSTRKETGDTEIEAIKNLAEAHKGQA